jgi:NitT/TauT family transport system permease protein
VNSAVASEIPALEGIDPSVREAMVQSHRARSASARRRQAVIVITRVGIVAAALGLWELLSRAQWLDTLFFSRPTLIWPFFSSQPQQFISNAFFTLQAVAAGFTLSAVCGITVGILLARFRGLAEVVQPIQVFLNSLPRIALVPLFILWFGISYQAKVATAFSLVFFIVLLNTQVGLATVDRELLLVTKLLGGNPRQVYFKVALPAAVPAIFGGLRLGVTYSLLGVVASEMVASRNGLGQLITLYGQNLEAGGVFATLAVMGALAAVISGLLGVVEQRLSRWKTSSE